MGWARREMAEAGRNYAAGSRAADAWSKPRTASMGYRGDQEELPNPNLRKIVVIFAGGTMLNVVSFILYIYAQQRGLADIPKFSYIVIVFAFLFLGSFCVCKAVLEYYAYVKFHEDSSSFGFRCVQINGTIIALGAGLVLMSLLHAFPYQIAQDLVELSNIRKDIGKAGAEEPPQALPGVAQPEGEATEKLGKEQDDKFEEIESHVHKVSESFGIIILIFAFENCFVYYLSYSIHWGYYKKRILRNTNFVQILKKFNRVLSQEEKSLGLRDKSYIIFQRLSQNREYITMEDFVALLGEESARDIFLLFDEDMNTQISSEEFYHGYVEILNERTLLKSSLNKRDKIIARLDAIFLIFCVVASVIIGATFMSSSKDLGDNKGSATNPSLVLFLGIYPLVTSTTSIHARIISEFISAIIFIFFVRPFDVGDFVVLEGKTYVVASFGLINSTFKTGEKVHSIPNSYIMERPVENLSRSLFYTGHFTVRVPLYLSEEILERLKEDIGNFIAERNKLFRKSFYLGKYDLPRPNTLHATLTYSLTCTCKDAANIKRREDALKLFVYRRVRELSTAQRRFE